MANDVETVALPLIQYSGVLGEADLIAIIDSGSVDKQIAVAKRKKVSETVSDALVDAGNAKVVGALLANHGADIAERSYGKVLDRFPGDVRIQELMIERPTLSLATTERLIACVSIELRERVLARQDFSGELADELIRHGQEGALTRSVAADRRDHEVEGLIKRLKGKGDLTPTLVLRALCEGDLNLFEAAIAAMADMSVDNARTFLHQRPRRPAHGVSQYRHAAADVSPDPARHRTGGHAARGVASGCGGRNLAPYRRPVGDRVRGFA